MRRQLVRQLRTLAVMKRRPFTRQDTPTRSSGGSEHAALAGMARLLARQATREAFAASRTTDDDPSCDTLASNVEPLVPATRSPEEPDEKETQA